MNKKIKKTKNIFNIFLIGGFVALNLFILAESMVPGGQSTETSMSWTNFFASIAEFFGNDKAPIVEPESVEISGFDTIIIGESKRLTATVLPDTTTDKSITWASDNDAVAEVTSGGIVVAKSLGDVRISSISSKETIGTYIDISVVDYPLPESFSLFTEKTDIFIGTTTTIDVVDLLPAKANKTSISWSSSPLGIASVNEYGVVKGLAEGNATVTASSGIFSENINIQVSTSPTPIIAPNLLHIIGNSEGNIYRYTQLSADFGEFPPTDTSVTWLSSDENIAQVDKTGKVFGTKFAGTVTISAIANAEESVFDTLDMTIEPVYPISFTLTPSSLSVVAGNSISLTPSFNPMDVTSKEISWSSSDNTVATVSSKGDYAEVLGLRSGTVTILAVSKMDETVFSQIEIKVEKAAVLTPSDRAELNNFIRKALGHFAVFFVDGVMAFLVFFIFLSKHPAWKKILFSLSIGAFIAALSETLQLFTAGRAGKVMDALLDCSGYFSAVFLALLSVHLFNKWKESSKNKSKPS